MWHGLRPVSPLAPWRSPPVGRCLIASGLAHAIALTVWVALPAQRPVAMPKAFDAILLTPSPLNREASRAQETHRPEAVETHARRMERSVASAPAAIRKAVPVPTHSVVPVVAAAKASDVAPAAAPVAVPVVAPAAPPVARATEGAAPRLASDASGRSAAPSTGAPAADEGRTRASEATLDAYAHTLSALLARQRSYPSVAALRGWEGEVRLTLRIARRGALLDVQVAHSSGYEVLDRNAVQLVQQAAPLPQPPEGLDAAEFQVSVPIQYRLRKNS